jgi:hypothetical protein
MDIEDLETAAEEGEMMFLEPRNIYDAAIIGIAERAGGMHVVAYSSALCIEALKKDGWDGEDAQEWFEFNTVSSYVGEGTPIFIDLLDSFVPQKSD